MLSMPVRARKTRSLSWGGMRELACVVEMVRGGLFAGGWSGGMGPCVEMLDGGVGVGMVLALPFGMGMS